MTNEEVQNMKAGREMDALIEKHIFYHDTFEKEVIRHTSNANKQKDRNIIEKELWAVLTKYSSAPVRNYSTTISAAWEVVKEVVGTNESNDFELITTVSGWKCIFSDAHAEYKARGETAHEAICKAALMTVCGKVVK